MNLDTRLVHHVFIEDLVSFISHHKNLPASHVRRLIPNAFWYRNHILKATNRKSWCQEVTRYMRENKIKIMHTELNITHTALRERNLR